MKALLLACVVGVPLAGVDVPLSRGLLLEFYWRRDFNAPVSDRVFVGARWELRGRF